jgi:diadenosine tetraphosphate (Ap4A) HIT family hydrolase
LHRSEHTLAFLDGYPITEGHALVIPKRHVASMFDLPEDELAALWKAVGAVGISLRMQFNPDGFNIGVNHGEVAGQPIPHAHVHIIPRRKGDCADPRGGIRWIMPNKAKCW